MNNYNNKSLKRLQYEKKILEEKIKSNQENTKEDEINLERIEELIDSRKKMLRFSLVVFIVVMIIIFLLAL